MLCFTSDSMLSMVAKSKEETPLGCMETKSGAMSSGQIISISFQFGCSNSEWM